MQFLRSTLEPRGVVTAVSLSRFTKESRVTVAGLVLLRQRPGSAEGVVFMTLEDETGTVNLIFWPDTWERFRREAHAAKALAVTGRLQRERGVVHVLAESLENLTGFLAGVRSSLRDFR